MGSCCVMQGAQWMLCDDLEEWDGDMSILVTHPCRCMVDTNTTL